MGCYRADMRIHLAFALFSFALLACEAKKPKAGDVCKIEENGSSVCADEKTALTCQAGKRIELPCRGAKGCVAGTCDTSLSREGDRCIPVTDYVGGTARVCSEDKASVLRCTDGKLELDLRCRGPKGCDPAQSHLERSVDLACDRTVGEVGDPCNTRGWASEAIGACGVDKKSVVVCDKDENGKLVLSRVCAGPKGCTVGILSNTTIPAPVCDRGPVVAGGACGKDDAAECSADAKQLLSCDRATGKYAGQPCAANETCVHPDGLVARCSAKK